ncbi:hypothetical protein ABPG72_002469, partial [Tetrahymena utriculariae]
DFGFADCLSRTNGFGMNDCKGNDFYKAPECFLPNNYDEYNQEYINRGLNVSNRPSMAYLKIIINKKSQDEVSLKQQIYDLIQQEQAGNSNQIIQLNQTIISQKQQLQSLDTQVKNQQIEYQKINQTNIQLQEQISSLEAKLLVFKQKPQQINDQKFEPQPIQMKINQQIQQVSKQKEYIQMQQQNNDQKFQHQQIQMKTSEQIQQVQPQQAVNSWKPEVIQTFKTHFIGICLNLLIQILEQQYYPAIKNTEYSQNLKNLISQLLIKDPNKRYTLQHILDKPFIQQRLSKFQEEAESKSKSQNTRKKHTDINKFRTQFQKPFRKQGQQHFCCLQQNNNSNYQQTFNMIKPIQNSTNTKNQNLQNNQQNAQRQVQEEQKNEFVENQKRNLIQFGQNQQQNIEGVKLPIVCQKVNQNRNILFQQSTNQNTESTTLLKKQDQIRKCNPSPIPIIKNSQKHLKFHDLNKVRIINPNIQNQANNQTPSTKSTKQLEPIKTPTTYLSRRNTGYSIQDMDKSPISKKMDPQTTISTHDKKFPTRPSSIQQKHIQIVTQRKLQDKNDQDTINIPSSNQQLKKDQELNEQEKKISHFNQEHKESTNQNNQNLQTQIQKEEVNELTNNDSYQTTQKIKNTYSEKQETRDNPQNLQEQKNNEDPNYLGTPGGDQLFAKNKFNPILAEQNKIAGLQYRVDDAQEKIISHFKQEHKRESTNQNSQNIQKQIQKEEANEFINNNSYQTTQKIKETSQEKQETIDNPQNLQEQNNNENPNYLGTPGGDQLFAANKFNPILGEQNKIADFQYRVDVAQQDETQNKQNKENLVENQQSVQNDIECQKQKAFILPKEFSQFTKIYAKVINKPKNLGNTEKQNTLNEINKKQNLKQTDQVPTSPTKISNYSDKKHFTTKIKDNSDQQQSISSAKKNMSFELQQDSASCKFFTDKKIIQRIQTEKTCQEQLNEKNEGKKKIRKISYESGQKEIEQAHQSKQRPQKSSFFDRKQEKNQTVGQVNQLSQQYLINIQESLRSNQLQNQFGEQSQQKKQKLCNSSFKGVQENIYDENEQQSDEESFLKISTELDQNQNDSDQSIYISQLKSLIKTDPTQGQDIIQNYGTNEFTDTYLSDGIDKNCEFDQNQSYQEEKEEQEEEKQEKQHEDLDSEEERIEVQSQTRHDTRII